MRKIRLTIVIGLVACGFAFASLEHYLIYSASNDRYSLEGIDAVVEVEIDHYYALSDFDLILSYINEHNREASKSSNKQVDTTRRGAGVWNPYPDINLKKILTRRTVWVFDVSVKNCLDGRVEGDNIYIVYLEDQRCSYLEKPTQVIRKYFDENESGLLFGLVKTDWKEYSEGVGRRFLYEADGRRILNKADIIDKNIALSPKFRMYDKKKNIYIAREIGINIVPVKPIVEYDGSGLATTNKPGGEPVNLLFEELRLKQSQERELLKELEVDEPIQSPWVLKRLDTLLEMKKKGVTH